MLMTFDLRRRIDSSTYIPQNTPPKTYQNSKLRLVATLDSSGLLECKAILKSYIQIWLFFLIDVPQRVTLDVL